jgi:hypothetical protein
LAAPVVYACATGEDGDLPDTGVGGKDGGGGRNDATDTSDGGEEGGGSTDAESCKQQQCCTSAQCPPTPHVQETACNSGSCAISTCAAGWYDFDASYKTGCNCQGSSNGTSCATATVVPPLALGKSMTLTGNLPLEDAENWFQVSFTAAATNKAYHPKITISAEGGSEFVFDVSSACSGATLSCADRDAAASLTEWEEFYASKDAGTGPADAIAVEFTPIAPVGADGVVLIRVHRTAEAGSNCDSFELTVSD